MLYSNFSRVYDYYESLGWKGPDGKGTDTLLLYYYCDENKNPADAAFYEGFRKYGYQIFTFGKGFGDAYTTDVIAHEFTHCVTSVSLVEGDYYHNETFSALRPCALAIRSFTFAVRSVGLRRMSIFLRWSR